MHFFPPYPGGGFVQDRFRVCNPVTQDPLHCPQLDQADQPPSKLHCLIIHDLYSLEGPTQPVPPGLVQDRLRYCDPLPQVLVHSHQAPQLLHPPDTFSQQTPLYPALHWQLRRTSEPPFRQKRLHALAPIVVTKHFPPHCAGLAIGRLLY